MLDQRGKIYDSLCLMRSATTAATGQVGAAASVDGTLKIFDTGGGNSEGKLVADIDYCSLASPANATNLRYLVNLQGSNSATFGTPIVSLAQLWLGVNIDGTNVNHEVLVPSSVRNQATASRYVIPWQNNVAGTVYRYLRVWTSNPMNTTAAKTAVPGTVITGMDYSAFLTK